MKFLNRKSLTSQLICALAVSGYSHVSLAQSGDDTKYPSGSSTTAYGNPGEHRPETCDGSSELSLSSGTYMKAIVISKRYAATHQEEKECYQNRKTINVIESNSNKIIAELTLERATRNARVTLVSKITEVVKTGYNLQTEFRSTKLRPLDNKFKPISGIERKYYPYNFIDINAVEDCDQSQNCPSHALPDLIVPGFATAASGADADDVSKASRYFALDSQELSIIDFRQDGSDYKAKFFKSRFASGTGGRDGLAYTFSLAKDEALTHDFLINTNLKDLLDIKHRLQETTPGSVTPPDLSGERVVQIAYKNWARVDTNVALEQLEQIASSLAGSYDAVVLHTTDHSAEVANIFKNHGLRIYAYRFNGAIRNTNKGTIPGTAGLGGCGENGNEGPTPGTSIKSGCDYPNDYLLRRFNQESNIAEPIVFAKDKEGLETKAIAFDGPIAFRGSNLNWALLDLRQGRVRDQLVSDAETYIENGWDGIFLDGPLIWIDNGRAAIGGSGTNLAGADHRESPMSWAYARWLSMWQVRKAMKAIDPDARLGSLAAPFQYDHLHVTDYIAREFLFGIWKNIDEMGKATTELPESAYDLRAEYNFSQEPARDFQVQERRYIVNDFLPGTKSANPLFNYSARTWMEGTGFDRSYTDIGEIASEFKAPDFELVELDHHLDVLTSVASSSGLPESSSRLHINDISPEGTLVTTTGLSEFTASNDATFYLSDRVAVADITSYPYQYEGYSKADALFDFSANRKYVIADKSANTWRYSDRYFAWKRSDIYLLGNIHFSSPIEFPDSGDATKIAFKAYGFGDRKFTMRSPVTNVRRPAVRLRHSDGSVPSGQWLSGATIGDGLFEWTLPELRDGDHYWNIQVWNIRD